MTRPPSPCWKSLCRRVLPLGVRKPFWDALESARIFGISSARPHARGTILFYPEAPSIRYTITKVLRVLGHAIVDDPGTDAALVINWEDDTWRTPDPRLSELATRHRVLNAGCTDISKERVQDAFEAVFGYALAVDPLTFRGTCVIKSNQNGAHDGRTVECPIDRVGDGVVYQRFIRTELDDAVNEEFRVPVFGNVLPLAYIKHIYRSSGFADRYREVLPADAGAVFSQSERNGILRFCREMGLDLGELDILRDRIDGRIYIVDVNNTPMGPPHNMKLREYREAVRQLAEAFQAEFLD